MLLDIPPLPLGLLEPASESGKLPDDADDDAEALPDDELLPEFGSGAEPSGPGPFEEVSQPEAADEAGPWLEPGELDDAISLPLETSEEEAPPGRLDITLEDDVVVAPEVEELSDKERPLLGPLIDDDSVEEASPPENDPEPEPGTERELLWLALPDDGTAPLDDPAPDEVMDEAFDEGSQLGAPEEDALEEVAPELASGDDGPLDEPAPEAADDGEVPLDDPAPEEALRLEAGSAAEDSTEDIVPLDPVVDEALEPLDEPLAQPQQAQQPA